MIGHSEDILAAIVYKALRPLQFSTYQPLDATMQLLIFTWMMAARRYMVPRIGSWASFFPAARHPRPPTIFGQLLLLMPARPAKKGQLHFPLMAVSKPSPLTHDFIQLWVSKGYKKRLGEDSWGSPIQRKEGPEVCHSQDSLILPFTRWESGGNKHLSWFGVTASED